MTIPIAPRTGRALDLYIGERTVGPIFLGVEGGRMDQYCADRMVKRFLKVRFDSKTMWESAGSDQTAGTKRWSVHEILLESLWNKCD